MTAQAAAPDQSLLVYFGTYTGPSSQGIYLSHFDTATGKLTPPELAAQTRNPSFLALHPNHRFLYAVGEIDSFAGQRTGAVSAFKLEAKTGHLTLLNQQPSGGMGPCHLAVDQAGKYVLTANYGSGSIAALPIAADGRLGAPGARVQHQGSSVNPQRQAGPHAHFITTSPDDRFVLVCDLGLDQVLVYHKEVPTSLGAAVLGSPGQPPALLIPNTPASAALQPGAGPRHLAFHPNGRFAYVINEMGGSVTAFAYDAKRGQLSEIQTISTLPADFTGGNTCAEVQVHPSGKFLYASNRGHDSLAVFELNEQTGKMTFVQHQPTQGKNPRHFTLDPSGQWLLAENQSSDSVVVFRVEPRTGRLAATGQSITVGSPVCAVLLAPAP